MCAISLLAGCPDRSISEVIPQQGRVEYKDIPVSVNRDIDILFLIDDSPSMADKQRNIGDNFTKFIDVLNTIPGGLPNVHIGVTTSDLGTYADDDHASGPPVGSGQGACSNKGKGGNLQTYGVATTGGQFLSDILDDANPPNRIQNFTGDLATNFSQIAKGAGVNGCGFEQHLEAIHQALANNTNNSQFLRPDAFLAVIILADEDDCSMSHSSLLGNDPNLGALASFRCTRFGVTCDQGGTTPDEMNQVGAKGQCHSNESKQFLTDVQRYIDFLRGLKSDPNSVIVALIGGPNTPVATELRPPPNGGAGIPALAHSCSYVDSNGQQEVADPAVRQTQWINGFPNRSTFTTICQNDLSDGLTLIAQLLKSVIGSPCIDGRLQQPIDCSVSYVIDPGQPDQKETILPECDNTTTPKSSTNQPCWAIVNDPTNCTGGTHDSLVIADPQTEPKGTHEIANCVTVTCDNNGMCDTAFGETHDNCPMDCP